MFSFKLQTDFKLYSLLRVREECLQIDAQAPNTSVLQTVVSNVEL